VARVLKNWIKAYMEYTSAMEAPDHFHFWAAVSTIAGALRRKVWVDMGHFQWFPNFYVIFVAPPGIVSKSTTMSIGMEMLRSIKDVKFGPDAVTWQALTQALAASRIDFPLDGAFVPMSAITLFSSEFGTFLNPHDREMVDVLVDLWDNRTGAWEKRTKMSGSDTVVNPWINIAACTTPAWIAGNFPEYMVGGGFTSRCVFVFAEKKRRLVAYPFLDMSLTKMVEIRDQLTTDLAEISRLAGKFYMPSETIDYGVQWYQEHYENINKSLNNSQFAGYLARKQTHIHKLAMVLSAADNNDLVIQKSHLEMASMIITSLEADMPRVFSTIGSEGDARHASTVLDIIRAYQKIDKKALFRLCASKMTVQEFSAAIESCVFQGYVQAYANGDHVTYVFVPPEPEGPSEKGS
jgi:hypothetical protein